MEGQSDRWTDGSILLWLWEYKHSPFRKTMAASAKQIKFSQKP